MEALLRRKSEVVASPGIDSANNNNSDPPRTPPSKKGSIGLKFKDILKKVRDSSEFENEAELQVDTELNGEPKKRVTIGEIVGTPSRDKSLRQKNFEGDNIKGKARSLGFHSIKAGLGRKEYEEFVMKSPVKPLALRLMEMGSGGGGSGPRRSILVRMKTENSINGIVLPPLNRSVRDLGTSRSDGGGMEAGGSLTSLDSRGTPLQFPLSSTPKGDLSQSKENSIVSLKKSTPRDDYFNEGFESSIDSLEHHTIKEEERLAKAADDAKALPAVAPFLLNELQDEDMIERRFGWKRSGNTSAAHDSRIDFLAMANGVGRSANEQDPPSRRPVVKLGEISPIGSMRQSLRGALLVPSGKAPPPGKLARKATMANLTGSSGGGAGAATGAPGSSMTPEPDPIESIMEHYCGLLYRDPHSNSTWKDLNTPSKVKGFFASQKQALSAGRNMNAYRPWGPERRIDPLDAILEQSITRSLESSTAEDYDDGARGRKKNHSPHKSRLSQSHSRSHSRPSSTSTHRKSRTRHHQSPSVSPSPHRPSSSSLGRSPPRSRVSSAEGQRHQTPRLETIASQSFRESRDSPSQRVKSGLTLETSLEMGSLEQQSQNHSHSFPSSPTHRSDSPKEMIERSMSGSADHDSPSHSGTTKKRSPLLINYVKVPLGWGGDD